MSKSNDIWHRMHTLDKKRRNFQKDAMAEFDRGVFHPERKALFEECKALGHPGSRTMQNNGLGWTFEYCGDCTQMIKKHGPDGQEIEV